MNRLGVMLVVWAGCGRLDFEARELGTTYPDVVASAGPLAWWRFEDTGPTARDELGRALGTIEGSAERVAGVAGQALELDGSTTRVVLEPGFSFAAGATYSIELWARPSMVDDQVRYLLEQRNPQADGYALYFARDFTISSRTVGDVEGGYATGPGLLADRFSHVVATFDGGHTALWIDAVLTDGMDHTLVLSSAEGTLVLGDKATPEFFKFLGALDEVALYDRTLSEAEIATHHAAR